MVYLKLAFEKRSFKADETPQSVFSHVAGDYACLLESSADGNYSFIGYDPFLFVWSDNGVTNILKRKNFCDIKKSAVQQISDGDPLDVLAELVKKYAYTGKAPVPFYGGAAGFFSYDFGSGFVGVTQKVFDDTHVPDYCFSFFNKVIAFDHQKKEIFYLGIADTETSAERSVEEIKKDLKKPIQIVRKGETAVIASNLSKKQYGEKIKAIKKLLEAGETYQVNFSQRFSGECSVEPWNAYKNLAQKSPAPFACYFRYPEFAIASSSPELLLRKRKEIVETWPIKGTVARGKNAQEDLAAEQTLLASAKDTAELNMIVDLERNDFGKVCEPGSIKVVAHREIQKLSHVIHTYSRIIGKLAKGKDIFDAIRAIFPGGSITGCPKKRTMEIIDRLEDYRRGVYTGSAGYINFSGDSDLNILIRTMLFKDGKVYFHAGGGIVIDSDGEAEYAETMHKSEGIRQSLMKIGESSKINSL